MKLRFHISVEGGSEPLYTDTGLQLSEGFERVVIGERGPYIEFSIDQLCMDHLHIPSNCTYRLDNHAVYYTEYRTTDKACVKVYRQKKTVAYADYTIGNWYASPKDLFLQDGSSVILSEASLFDGVI